MFDQLERMQQEMEAAKSRLEEMTVEAELEGIKVTANGNTRLINISIPAELANGDDAEQLEDLLLTVINRVLDELQMLNATEMNKVAMGMLPPGFELP